jgi:hypothetical protein
VEAAILDIDDRVFTYKSYEIAQELRSRKTDNRRMGYHTLVAAYYTSWESFGAEFLKLDAKMAKSMLILKSVYSIYQQAKEAANKTNSELNEIMQRRK